MGNNDRGHGQGQGPTYINYNSSIDSGVVAFTNAWSNPMAWYFPPA